MVDIEDFSAGDLDSGPRYATDPLQDLGPMSAQYHHHFSNIVSKL